MWEGSRGGRGQSWGERAVVGGEDSPGERTASAQVSRGLPCRRRVKLAGRYTQHLEALDVDVSFE